MMERSITVRVDVLQETRWVSVEQTGGSAEQFRGLIMSLESRVKQARSDLCKARRKLGAALLQIKQQVSYGEWTSFITSLEANEKTLRNAISLVERLCDVNGEFVEAKINEAKRLRPTVHVGDERSMSLTRAEQLAGIRPVKNPNEHRVWNNVPNSDRVRYGSTQNEIVGGVGPMKDRPDTEFGTTVPNSDSVRYTPANFATEFHDDDDDRDDADARDSAHLDDDDDAAWQSGQQMTFEDLRASAVADATRLCGLLQRPDADPDLVQRFHAWAQRELT